MTASIGKTNNNVLLIENKKRAIDSKYLEELSRVCEQNENLRCIIRELRMQKGLHSNIESVFTNIQSEMVSKHHFESYKRINDEKYKELELSFRKFSQEIYHKIENIEKFVKTDLHEIKTYIQRRELKHQSSFLDEKYFNSEIIAGDIQAVEPVNYKHIHRKNEDCERTTLDPQNSILLSQEFKMEVSTSHDDSLPDSSISSISTGSFTEQSNNIEDIPSVFLGDDELSDDEFQSQFVPGLESITEENESIGSSFEDLYVNTATDKKMNNQKEYENDDIINECDDVFTHKENIYMIDTSTQTQEFSVEKEILTKKKIIDLENTVYNLTLQLTIKDNEIKELKDNIELSKKQKVENVIDVNLLDLRSAEEQLQNLEEIRYVLENNTTELERANQRLILLQAEKEALCKSVTIEQQVNDRLTMENLNLKEKEQLVDNMNRFYEDKMREYEKEIKLLKSQVNVNKVPSKSRNSLFRWKKKTERENNLSRNNNHYLSGQKSFSHEDLTLPLF